MANGGHPEKPGPSSSREASRAALLVEVRALAGASLQKLWLASPQLIALQLRTPGRSFVVAVDAERAMALVADERPSSPESALKSQATLRAALSGARFDSASLVMPLEAHETTRQLSLRLEFTTPSGRRALHADPRAHALVLSAIGAAADLEKIIWAAPGAAAAFRPGAVIAPWRALQAHAPAAQDDGPNTKSTAVDLSGPAGSTAVDRAQDLESTVVDLDEGIVSTVVDMGEGARRAPHEISHEARALATETLAARAAERFAAEKQALVRALKTKAQKLARTREAVERDSAQAAKAVGARRLAELLLPHQSKIPRGAQEAIVPDWSQLDEEGNPAQVAIALDPALGAAANASRMLKKAQRYTAAGPRIAARLVEIAQAHEEAKEQLARAESATSAAGLRGLSASQTNKRPQLTPQQRMKTERLPYRAYRASNGARILVGRSAKDNDTLTLKWARGDDLWLHARGVHGSHVILVEPGTAPDARALGEAALLAAHFSSARGADGAEVSWTRRKYVRKGKGLAPGAVTFSQEKTLRVRLDEAGLQGLLAREEP